MKYIFGIPFFLALFAAFFTLFEWHNTSISVVVGLITFFLMLALIINSIHKTITKVSKDIKDGWQ